MTALTESQAAVAIDAESARADEHPNSAANDKVPLRIRVSERFFDWSEQLPTLRDAREAFDRVYLEELLRRVGGNVSAAARVSGRNRTDLYDLLRRCHVDPTQFRS